MSDSLSSFSSASSLFQNNFFVGAICAAIFGYFTVYLRNIGTFVWTYLISRFLPSVKIDSDDSLFDWVDKEIASAYSSLSTGSCRALLDLEAVDSDSAFPKFRLIRDWMQLHWISFKPAAGESKMRRVFVWRSRSNVAPGSSFVNGDSNQFRSSREKRAETIHLYCLSLSNQPLVDFMDHCRKKAIGSQKVCIYRHEFKWGLLNTRMPRPIRSVVLPHGQMQMLVNDFQEFIRSREWHVNLGLPYQRGYLFSGPPGTGKTSTIVALASYLGLGLCPVDFSNRMMDHMLTAAFSKPPTNSIILVEDVDAIADDREVQEPRAPGRHSPPKISLSGLLNAIDGVSSSDGRILIMTTNYPERLDAALTRKGRVNVHFKFEYARDEQIQRQIALIYAMEGGTLSDQHSDRVETLVPTGDSGETTKRFCTKLRQEIADLQPKASNCVTMSDIQNFLTLHRDSFEDALANTGELANEIVASYRAKQEKLRVSQETKKNK